MQEHGREKSFLLQPVEKEAVAQEAGGQDSAVKPRNSNKVSPVVVECRTQDMACSA